MHVAIAETTGQQEGLTSISVGLVLGGSLQK